MAPSNSRAASAKGGVQGYFVNRLTPASYPATLRKVLIQFPASGAPLNGLPLGSAIQIVTSSTTGSGPQLPGITLTRTNASVIGFNTFIEYDVPALTLQSGDFLVGFTVLNPQGIYPAAVDVSSPMQRSCIGSDGTNFFLYETFSGVRPGNLAIQARVDYGGVPGSPTLAALRISPTSLSFTAADIGTPKFVGADNPNSQTITIVRLSSSDPNFVNATPLPAPTGPGSFNFVQIRYAPTGAGNHAGTITVETDPPAATAQFTVTSANSASPGSACIAAPASQVTWLSGDGSAADLAGSNPAALVGGATFTTGKVGQAFQLNGTSAHVSLGDPASLRFTSALTNERNLLPVFFHLIGANVLRNFTRFARGDIGRAYGVEQRRLAMVDVTHDRYHRRTRL